MDNGNKTPNLNLPPPIPQGVETLPQLPEADTQQGIETAPAAPSKETGPTLPRSTTSSAADPITAAAAGTLATAPVASDAPAIADDNDLIEKEWVLKAKQIVERTKDDPYNQNKELNVFKADYMKKRYNKSIKLSE